MAKRETTVSRYRNAWHRSGEPEFYKTDKRPTEYRGFQIFHRHEGLWELVKDGVCLTQRAGRNGPRNLADALCGDANDEPQWLVERAIAVAAQFDVSLPMRQAA